VKDLITPAKLHISMIQEYQRCPYSYNLKYVKRVKPTKIRASRIFGDVLHRALAAHNRDGANLRDYALKLWREQFQDFEELLALYDKYASVMEDLMKRYTKPKATSDYKEKVTPIISKVDDIVESETFPYKFGKRDTFFYLTDLITTVCKEYEKANAFKVATPLCVEATIDFELLGRLCTCRLDLVEKLQDGTVEIIEYKTGPQRPDEFAIAYNQQLTLYHYALKQGLNIDADRVVIYHLRSNTRFEGTRKEEDYPVLFENLKETLRGIEQNIYFRTLNESCSWCDYADQCIKPS